MSRIWVLACAVLLAAAVVRPGHAQNGLADLINGKLPHVAEDAIHNNAVATAFAALDTQHGANLAAGLSTGDIAARLNADGNVRRLGFSNIALSGKSQLLHVDAIIERALDETSFPSLEGMLATLLKQLHPHVKVEIAAGLAINSGVASDSQKGATITLDLVPVFERITVQEFRVDSPLGTVPLDSVASLFAGLLHRYADTITASIVKRNLWRVTVPAAPFASQDISRSVQILNQEGSTLTADIRAQPISLPVKISSIVSLVDEDRITVLAELLRADGAASVATGTVSSAALRDFDGLRSAVDDRVKLVIGTAGVPPGDWVAIAKPLVATVVNSAFAQAKICVATNGVLANQSFQKKVGLPDGTQIDCTPTRDCTPVRECTPTAECGQPHDTRDCSACIVRNPFGGCVVRGNDPICEAQKGAQNAAYAGAKASCEAAKSAAKADCERLKTQQKAQCEVEKTGQKMACETAKGAVIAIDHTGNFANLDGSFAGSARLDVCINRGTVSDSLHEMKLALAVEGHGDANVSLRFTPLDIVGHLVCQAPWTENKHVHIMVPSQTAAVSGALELIGGGDSATYSLAMKYSELQSRVEPSPRDLIISSYNLTLACSPVAPLLHTLAFTLAPFVPELRGDVSIPGGVRSLDFEIRPILLEQNGIRRDLEFRERPTALLFVAASR